MNRRFSIEGTNETIENTIPDKKQSNKSLNGFGKDELVNALKLMYTSRQFDNKSMTLLKQGKAFFHIAAAGHEAAQVACALNMKTGVDWAFPYYRDMAFVLSAGLEIKDLFLGLLGKADDPMTAGRQMPCHWGSKELNMPVQSSPTGSQFLQAVGTALAGMKTGINSVTYVSSGEGTTSEGEFHEAVNWASRDKLPVVFLIENNKYAISVPVNNQSGGKDASIAEMMLGYNNLFRQRVDGTDYIAMFNAAQAAYKYCRDGDGPALIEAEVVRLFPHSSSDDQRKYRRPEEITDDLKRCPIENFSKLLISEQIISEQEYFDLKSAVNKEIDEAAMWALKQPDPLPESATKHVFDESGLRFELHYEANPPVSKPVVMVDAINHALHEEMKLNDKIYIFGEDVADEKGGVFTATKGLSTQFGKDRVFNSPLAEASIIGVANGMALAGLKPVVEIQFGDYIWPAFMQYRDEMVMMRYRSNNLWAAPVVTRVAVGGYIHGGLYHSQNIEGFFAHMPGIYIAYPSNAADAKGLLKTAMRLNDPVLFLEHKGLYRQSFAMSPEPDAEYLLAFGKAKVVKEGTDITIVTYGAMVHDSKFAAGKLEAEGYSVEVIDIRTIVPLDEETIFNSVKKTGKVIVIHEDTLTGGFGAEIAARISDHCFKYLDGPVKRLAAEDTPIPFHPNLETAILPTKNKIINAVRELAEY